MEPSLHKAKWVMVEPEVWIENGMVEVTSDRISAVGKARTGADVHDHGSGVILPALTNAHTHLSLSCLSGRMRPDSGFVNWVKELIEAGNFFLCPTDTYRGHPSGGTDPTDWNGTRCRGWPLGTWGRFHDPRRPGGLCFP